MDTGDIMDDFIHGHHRGRGTKQLDDLLILSTKIQLFPAIIF
jgi:hypothetical protein